jgi:8-oxo-dGTP pyrophosphatase MutT (NUDIX family)
VAFMGGMWVFPGGRLDEADRSPQALARIRPGARPASAGRMLTMAGTPLDPETEDGLAVAACREAYEEAGVLLACAGDGTPCDPATVVRLASMRSQVAADAGAFTRMLEDEDLYLNTGQLVYWSHWITPSIEPKRFDTRFFVARLPYGQCASPDLSELTEQAWIDTATVPDSLARGEIRIVPPTLLTLEDLAETYAARHSLDALLAAEGARDTPPIMPRIELKPEGPCVVMPWDPGYAGLPGEGCDVGDRLPGHLARRRSNVPVVSGGSPRRE